MDSPGARSDMNDAMFENHDTTSDLSVEPTLTAVEMHPGLDSELVKPLFPAAMAVAIPIDRRLSIAGLYGWLSHGAENVEPPRLMLTDAMWYCGATVETR